MKIRDLKKGQTVDYVRARVVDMSDVKKVISKFGKALSLVNVTLEDETGRIPLTLWERDVNKVKVGDTVEIRDAFVKEFRGEKILTLGRRGTLKVV